MFDGVSIMLHLFTVDLLRDFLSLCHRSFLFAAERFPIFSGLDLSLLTSYHFLVVCIGTAVLAGVAALIGTLTVLREQSLIGDVIGHTSYPGVIVAFMLCFSLHPLALFGGAVIAGAIAYAFMLLLKKQTDLGMDAILALTLSSWFGLGMVLKSYIQGHEVYGKLRQGGLKNYIFGQAAFIKTADVYLIILVSIPILLIFFLFKKHLEIFLFDEGYAQVIGIPTNRLHMILLLQCMALIAAGLKFIGAIQIASLLMIPPVTALQWSRRFNHVLLIAVLIAVLAASSGTYLSSLYTGLSTGATMVLIMALFFFLSVFCQSLHRKRKKADG